VVGGRELLGGLLAGVGGAAVIAALVLGRGDAAPRMDLAALAALDDGGVLVARIEVYQRHGAKAEEIAGLLAEGDRYLFPERYVTEDWLLLGPEAYMLESTRATWTSDGQLLERQRMVGREMVIERPGRGVVHESTLPGSGLGQMQVPPSVLLAESRADVEQRLASGNWELVAPSRVGTLVIVSSRPIVPGELRAQEVAMRSGFYFADLPATRFVTEETYTAEYWPTGSRRWAVLDNGSRILVESRTFTIEARAAAEWDGFVARVWGE
jgi:hypothetical protein